MLWQNRNEKKHWSMDAFFIASFRCSINSRHSGGFLFCSTINVFWLKFSWASSPFNGHCAKWFRGMKREKMKKLIHTMHYGFMPLWNIIPHYLSAYYVFLPLRTKHHLSWLYSLSLSRAVSLFLWLYSSFALSLEDLLQLIAWSHIHASLTHLIYVVKGEKTYFFGHMMRYANLIEVVIELTTVPCTIYSMLTMVLLHFNKEWL